MALKACTLGEWNTCGRFDDCYVLPENGTNIGAACGCSKWIGVYGQYPDCSSLGAAAIVTMLVMAFGILFKLGITAWVVSLLFAASKSTKARHQGMFAGVILTIQGWCVCSCGLSSIVGTLWHLFYLLRTALATDQSSYEWLYYPAYFGQFLRDLFLMQAVIFIAVSWLELVNASKKLRKINTEAVRRGCFVVAAVFPVVVGIAFFTDNQILVGITFLLWQIMIIVVYLLARRRLSKLLLETNEKPRAGDKRAEKKFEKRAKVKVAIKKATRLTAHIIFWVLVTTASNI